jgi:3-oxoacid CoA-transferase subunit A
MHLRRRLGEIELVIYPMGTLAEKYRAAGAGIPAFYTTVGSGSMVEETILSNIENHRTKKETKQINGQTCFLEYSLKLDYAFIHAYMGDEV